MEAEPDSFTNSQLNIDELPRWEDIEMEPLARATPWVSFWQSCISLSIFMVAAMVAVVLLPIHIGFSLLVLLAGLVFFAVSQGYNFKEHRLRGVAVREKDIVFKKGLLWHQSTVLPFNRIQHIEIHRSFLERQLNLSSLRLFTAGGAGVDLLISGLESDRADRMKQFILEKTKSEALEK